jgi:hypothetical protein
MGTTKLVQITHRGLPQPQQGLWDAIVEFSIYLDDVGMADDLEGLANQRLHDTVAWINEHFQHNHILVEHVEASISGGWVDNREAWRRHPEISREAYAWRASYELRCHDQDANWFCLTFQ